MCMHASALVGACPDPPLTHVSPPHPTARRSRTLTSNVQLEECASWLRDMSATHSVSKSWYVNGMQPSSGSATCSAKGLRGWVGGGFGPQQACYPVRMHAHTCGIRPLEALCHPASWHGLMNQRVQVLRGGRTPTARSFMPRCSTSALARKTLELQARIVNCIGLDWRPAIHSGYSLPASL